MNIYQVNYTYLNTTLNKEYEANDYIRALSENEALTIAKSTLEELIKINRVTLFSSFYTRKYWFTFSTDGVWDSMGDYPHNSKEEAVEMLRFCCLDSRKRVVRRVKEGIYHYINDGFIIRGDKLEETGWLETLQEWLEENIANPC